MAGQDKEQKSEPSNGEAMPQSEARAESTTATKTEAKKSGIPIEFVIAASLVTICLGLMVYNNMPEHHSTRMISPTRLALFDGQGNNPSYLSILGEVFDVTKGRKFYGPDGSYKHFVGKDASRAFVTGDFVYDLTDDVSGLTNEQIASIVNWRDFYRKAYTPVGRLIGRYYFQDGRATRAMAKVEQAAAQAKSYEERRREQDAKWPKCNIRWSEAEGGYAWCDDGMYPRKLHILEEDNTPTTRCACFEQIGWSDLREIYPGCKPESNKCQISQPGKRQPAAHGAPPLLKEETVEGAKDEL